MKLKELVNLAPVLILPNDDLPFRLEANGSGITMGAVLSQQQVDNNAWHPVDNLNTTQTPEYTKDKYSSQQNCLNVFNLWKDALILHEINSGKV
jgi:hypothetical protein